jgi:8-oxo-dGTP pyrophosphatase MutT (NUDIX family)
VAITKRHIRDAVATYLSTHPDEKDDLRLLLDLLDSGADLTSRKEFRGHVTANAVLVNPSGQVLFIHHRSLNRWLTPGGHVEPSDSTLRDAALRELAEETGIGPADVQPLGDKAIHIDIHPIPPNDSKNEPAHCHIDFRFMFRTTANVAQLQAEEVTDAAWRDISTDANPVLRQRVVAALRRRNTTRSPSRQSTV